jgi:hypothetical protein
LDFPGWRPTRHCGKQAKVENEHRHRTHCYPPETAARFFPVQSLCERYRRKYGKRRNGHCPRGTLKEAGNHPKTDGTLNGSDKSANPRRVHPSRLRTDRVPHFSDFKSCGKNEQTANQHEQRLL